ncbi:TPA: hypothetical protein DIU27_04770 [Candidatus Collierbacteria bacterium]|uniref:Uncharacterized protein n=1 Tax=Candidatus Collierbacteria bacterium GW2011_GWB2_44_22 TaxID=1618387 RepID=A0A0G1K621_9BACT|nr:MAG: hypothetical protein UW31_C0016G0007 [Candidatus Collierbacteria bacterium GW2011_GWA2_44_13]KKT51777.1 MAG: hypothetical protein UW44_C0008G0099 [Candidatus Collierbacteria bacterium GW2011_GWB2_44_22]KKT65467.1 MAG: hypothetical protein UW58_C0029G0007 [Candidatus Collierbacteria bacterium GW2011_GWC2_44_30]KKT68313.1 MAG: hypothetical protein UW64_C0023G0029 [Microgenomates group bacterium GW2011_GWC1_44_37]KKT88001.1 MAG: hypothetical protein UW88_C0017G0022 [Candidatus Collierbacte
MFILTSLYVLITAMISNGFKRTSDQLVAALLAIMIIGVMVGFIFYAITIVPGPATIVGILLLCLVSIVLGSGFHQ